MNKCTYRRWVQGAALLLGLSAWAGPAAAVGPYARLSSATAPERVQLNRNGAFTGTLSAPQLVSGVPATTADQQRRLPAPFWTRTGLWARPPLPQLQPGDTTVSPPVYDPTSDSWFATSGGALGRIADDGTLRVILDNVQGQDFDVRAQARVAVSREGGRRIVLHRWTNGRVQHTVLFEGEAFFAPRLSPTGNALLVTQSRPEGGHVWLVRPLSGKPRDLGRADNAVWHPDGHHMVFARIRNNSRQVTGSDLWARDLERGREQRLTETDERAEITPALSPDGRWVAFVDGQTGALLVAALPILR